MTSLREAAQAVLDRWDSPEWEWSKRGSTAELMAALRAALAQEQQAKAWVCPEAPEVRYDKPGPCWDCGKPLVLARGIK